MVDVNKCKDSALIISCFPFPFLSRVCVFVIKYDPELSSRQFGVELSRLTSEERGVPQLVEKLINYIEMHGLYTEGIYRKSGSTNKIKELRQGLDTGKMRSVFYAETCSHDMYTALLIASLICQVCCALFIYLFLFNISCLAEWQSDLMSKYQVEAQQIYLT